MKITFRGDEIEGDRCEPLEQALREYLAERFGGWHAEGAVVAPESMAWRAALAHRCASHWWQYARSYLAHIDSLFRADGVVITIDITADRGIAKPESLRWQEGDWTIRLPLTWFPLVYSVALYYCAVEQTRPGLTADALVFDEEEANEEDPIERPLGWTLRLDKTTGGAEPEQWQEALRLSLDALMMVTMHELAHCLLGHHRGANRRNKTEMRIVEVEADTLAGILSAALDNRTEEQRQLGRPVWSTQQAENYARAANLLRIITRWNDSRLKEPDTKWSHHRATPRYHHLGLGALIRFNAANPAIVPVAEEALRTVPVFFAAEAMMSALEKYAEGEPESDSNWALYESETVTLSREVSAKLREHRVPILAKLLAGLGLQRHD